MHISRCPQPVPAGATVFGPSSLSRCLCSACFFPFVRGAVCLSLFLAGWLSVCVQIVSGCLREVCACMRVRVRVSVCARAWVCVVCVNVTHTLTRKRSTHVCTHTQALKAPSM